MPQDLHLPNGGGHGSHLWPLGRLACINTRKRLTALPGQSNVLRLYPRTFPRQGDPEGHPPLCKEHIKFIFGFTLQKGILSEPTFTEQQWSQAWNGGLVPGALASPLPPPRHPGLWFPAFFVALLRSFTSTSVLMAKRKAQPHPLPGTLSLSRVNPLC